MNFAAQNPAEYGVDGAIKMWRAIANSEASQETMNNSLDEVRQPQGTPAQGGVLQGQAPQTPKNDDEEMWDRVLNASSRANVL